MAHRPPYRVLIVEDHQVVAEGLTVLLDEHPDLTVVGWAATGADAARLAATEPFDVAVVDYWLPDRTGAETVAASDSTARSARTFIIRG